MLVEGKIDKIRWKDLHNLDIADLVKFSAEYNRIVESLYWKKSDHNYRFFTQVRLTISDRFVKAFFNQARKIHARKKGQEPQNLF